MGTSWRIYEKRFFEIGTEGRRESGDLGTFTEKKSLNLKDVKEPGGKREGGHSCQKKKNSTSKERLSVSRPSWGVGRDGVVVKDEDAESAEAMVEVVVMVVVVVVVLLVVVAWW